MVIAALASFAVLFVAWIVAPESMPTDQPATSRRMGGASLGSAFHRVKLTIKESAKSASA